MARKRKRPAFDTACFHAQQCAEKYLKARLNEAGLAVKRTHDLEVLLKQVLSLEPTWNLLRLELKYLSDFAVDYRYPGAQATKADTTQAIKACRRVRAVIRAALGLPV